MNACRPAAAHAASALAATGLAFKASVAPFHQWTPDVYQGAPTPITTFMAVATKAAAFAIFLRLFDQALGLSQLDWGPALAFLAATTIVIGNVGAIAQRSLKRMLAWSSVAQAGYLLAGVVVGTQLGVQATAFYLAVYLLMNVAAFAVVVARERVSEFGDDLRSFENLGTMAPLLAWPMTIAMLSLAGFPATAGFIGKFYLIDASVAGDYTWLGIAIVIGSVLSLAYYLRVIAVMWMGRYEVEMPSVPPRRVRPVAGWSPEADALAQPEVVAVAVICAAATIFFGLCAGPAVRRRPRRGQRLPGPARNARPPARSLHHKRAAAAGEVHLTQARGRGSLRETAFDIIESKSSARGGEVEEHTLSQRALAETLGTALLVLVGPGSVVATLVLAGDKVPAIDGSDLLGISFAFGS